MALKDFPDWVLKYKKPGQEIRLKAGRFYVYECKGVYDQEKHKSKKVTGKYLGTITEADGFTPAKHRMVKIDDSEGCQQNISSASTASEVKMVATCPIDLQFGTYSNLEFGFYHFFELYILNDYVPKLKMFFRDSWQTIMAMSYCKAMYKSPLKRMEADFRKSYMSVYLKDAKMSPKYLTGFIRDLGRNRALIIEFCKSLYDGKSAFISDGTDSHSLSRLMRINKYCKTKNGTYDYIFNIMKVFSVGQKIPIYYQVLPGNIKDVSSFSDCLDTMALDKKQTVIIIDPETETAMDKGFASEANFNKLDSRKLCYIVALKRNDSHLSYDCLRQKDYTGMDGVFEYEGRLIGYKYMGTWDTTHENRKVYLFYDKVLDREEDEDYQKRHKKDLITKEGREVYSEKSLRFGTLAIVSTCEKTPEKIYIGYKERNMVEDAISVFKSDLGLEETYMQDEIALEGWMFPMFLALLWHFVMRNVIADHKQTKKYSPRDVFRTFEGVRKLNISGQWKLTHIIKNDQKLLGKLGLLPEMDVLNIDQG